MVNFTHGPIFFFKPTKVIDCIQKSGKCVFILSEHVLQFKSLQVNLFTNLKPNTFYRFYIMLQPFSKSSRTIADKTNLVFFLWKKGVR